MVGLHARGDDPASGFGLNGLHRGVGEQRRRGRVAETTVSARCCMPFLSEVKSGGAGLRRPRGHFLSRGEHGAAEAAVRAFHLREARKNGAHAEAGGFSAVDAGEQRVGEAVDHLRGRSGARRRRRRTRRRSTARGGWKNSRVMRSLVFQRKERRQASGQNFCRDHEHQAVGHFDEAAVGQDVGLAVGVVGADELIAEAKRAAEIGGPGLFGDEGIGAGFDDASVDVFGAEDAAEARGGFVESVARPRRRRGGALRGRRRRRVRRCLRR